MMLEKMKYRPDVDGLRAIAVLPVLLFHSGISLFSGGYVGVDIFFVISGFVISQTLIKEIEGGHYSIANFYVRRIRRILPALVATILLSSVLALLVFLPNTMREFSTSVTATVLFVSNIYFWKHSGYFEITALDRPLLHTWSLSVEEQFYILIPVALFFTYRLFRNLTWPLFSLGAAASLALSIFLTDRGPTANFFLLPTRAWELLLGSIIVLANSKPAGNWILREVSAVIGLCLIVFAVTTYTDATPFPGLAALVPTLGAALIIQSGRDQATLVGRLLSWHPLVGIGLISYSLYLVHWPIIVFARYALLRDLVGWEIGAFIILSLVLAYLSWRFIETPFRHPARVQPRTTLFAATAMVLATLAALGIVGAFTDGFHARFSNFRPPPATEAGGDVWLRGRCFLENQDPAAWKGDFCVRTSGSPKNAVLWGDSFAAHYLPGLIKNQDRLSHNIIQYTFAGCPPILSYTSYARPGCAGFNAAIFEVIRHYHADAVVMSSRWDQIRQRGLSGLRDTVERLQAAGVTVYVLGQSPMFAFDVDILDARDAGQDKNAGSSAWYLSFNPIENARLRAASGSAIFVDPLPTFCTGRLCEYKVPTGLLFYDYGHFSDIGSDLAVGSYFPLSVDGRLARPINK
jgi:peptidoglycan/LPS O-acetylase OafA/YrhL